MNSSPPNSSRVASALHITLIGVAINAVLVFIKGAAGLAGNSYALVADAIESIFDIISSLVVYFGLRMAQKPADENHPYGHGKAEPLAAAAVALMLLAAAGGIAKESWNLIKTPHAPPEKFTLPVLLLVVFIKEALHRRSKKIGDQTVSVAVKTDAWHHRSDAITSAAVFVGISVAIAAGPGYEYFDDCAALFASAIIAANSLFLLLPALSELIDTSPDQALLTRIRDIAATVPGVLGTHKCHARKFGFGYFVDLDVLCNPNSTIREGHDIAHAVGGRLQSEIPDITRVLVHVEPVDDYGRRNK